MAGEKGGFTGRVSVSAWGGCDAVEKRAGQEGQVEGEDMYICAC